MGKNRVACPEASIGTRRAFLESQHRARSGTDEREAFDSWQFSACQDGIPDQNRIRIGPDRTRYWTGIGPEWTRYWIGAEAGLDRTRLDTRLDQILDET